MPLPKQREGESLAAWEARIKVEYEDSNAMRGLARLDELRSFRDAFAPGTAAWRDADADIVARHNPDTLAVLDEAAEAERGAEAIERAAAAVARADAQVKAATELRHAVITKSVGDMTDTELAAFERQHGIRRY